MTAVVGPLQVPLRSGQSWAAAVMGNKASAAASEAAVSTVVEIEWIVMESFPRNRRGPPAARFCATAEGAAMDVMRDGEQARVRPALIRQKSQQHRALQAL
jgi:hypothetical protein